MKVITLARKPFSGTVAHNMLTHGCGGLNINKCRVGASESDDYGRSVTNSDGTINAHGGFSGKAFKINERDEEYASNYAHTSGRWPSNLIFQHCEDCRCEGIKKVKGIAGGSERVSSPRWRPCPNFRSHSGVAQTHEVGAKLKRHRIARHNDPEGNETVADWVCVEDCPIKTLDEQSIAGGMHSAGSSRKASRSAGKTGMFPMDGDGHRFGDTGGASRFFKQVKP